MGEMVTRLYNESGLSHPQVQIWIGQQLDPTSALYSMAFTFRLDGAVERELFRTAWRRVVDASDSLRTTVEEVDGLAVRQIADPGTGAELELLDLSVENDPESAFRSWAHERAAIALRLDHQLVDSVLVCLDTETFCWYLNQHHLITDAASTVLLFRQTSAEYERLLASSEGNPERIPGGGATPPIAPLEPYYPTVEALQKTFADDVHLSVLAYWRQKLDAGDRSVAFYGRSVAATRQSSRRYALRLDAQRSERLRELAGESGFLTFTPDISLFAVFATLLVSWLHRVSGERAVGFDTPALNRPNAAAKRSVGLFVEMFPFFVGVEPEDTFRTLGENCLGETQSFLQHALPATSAPSGATVSNVVLNFFPGTFGPFAGLPSTVDWVHPGQGDSVHALRLQVHDFDGTGCYTLQFDANEEVFSPVAAERALRQLERTLDQFLEDPDRRIAEIDLLSESDRTAQLEFFNDSSSPPLPRQAVSARIAQQAKETPSRVALRQGEREMTFADLSASVDRLAAVLARRGVMPGERLAVYGKRSIETVIGILAVLRARAAYVPIDPGYPQARIRQILDDCGAQWVLTAGGLEPPSVETASDRAWKILNLDEQLELGGDPSPPAVLSEVEDRIDFSQLDDLAYVIYTSGSTGRPKGVLIEHGGLADYLEWAERQYVRGEQMSFPLFTSLSFDLTVTSLFLPLVTGGTLQIYEEPVGPVDSALMDVIGDNAVDFIKLTPSHLSLLKQMDLSASRLRRMVVGGEDFRTDLARAISGQFGGGIEIYNEYGPTEAVVGCAIHRFDPEVDSELRVPIGRPAAHVQLYVLNEQFLPVPAGVPGELCVSRFGLARGYHGREELTTQQFVPHPFRAGERLYRTGDRVRFAVPPEGEEASEQSSQRSGGGVLEYLGRLDRQVKISGFRVEPGEVETALGEHPAIESSVVVAQRRKGYSVTSGEVTHCKRCGLASSYPRVVFDEHGVCEVCRTYEAISERADAYFRSMDDLREIFCESSVRKRGKYDCLALLSGGKDSTYVLCQLVDLGYTPFAFTLDNGYISEEAKGNVRRVVEALGVDHEFGSTPAMNAIFKDSLTRFSNVCNGCFKTIYTLSTQRAVELGIPIIVTGLSRGQFFETRLTEDLFRGRFQPDDVDRAVLEARKAYHRVDDAVSQLLDVELFRDDRVFEEIEFVDFYRYSDTSLQELIDYLGRRVPWVRPSDTGRSTNCLINDVGIYLHKKERGFHNYALPYSWDVRLGHKQRDEAMEELDDEIDLESVRSMLSEVGYDENRLGDGSGASYLVGYYVAPQPIAGADLRRHLAARLPEALVPSQLVHLTAMPLSPNGKIDTAALPLPGGTAGASSPSYVSPQGTAEEQVAAIWGELLELDRVGVTESFFQLGGTSLAAMEVMLRICNLFQIDLPLQTLFQYPTVRELAAKVEARLIEEISLLSDDEADRLVGSDSATGDQGG